MAKRATKFNPETITRRQAAAQLRKAVSQYETKTQAAKSMHIPRSTLNGWLSKQSVPTQRAAERSAKALNRIHYAPPPQPPRVKAYSREELAKIAVWASAAGPESITSKKLTGNRIQEAATAFFSGSEKPVVRADRIEDIRARFIAYVQAHEDSSDKIQLAGDKFFTEAMGDVAPDDFARAWSEEMKTLMQAVGKDIDFVPSLTKTDMENQRREGWWSTKNPMHFVQVFEYLRTLPNGYFAIHMNRDTGEISIFEVEQVAESESEDDNG